MNDAYTYAVNAGRFIGPNRPTVQMAIDAFLGVKRHDTRTWEEHQEHGAFVRCYQKLPVGDIIQRDGVFVWTDTGEAVESQEATVE